MFIYLSLIILKRTQLTRQPPLPTDELLQQSPSITSSTYLCIYPFRQFPGAPPIFISLYLSLYPSSFLERSSLTSWHVSRHCRQISCRRRCNGSSRSTWLWSGSSRSVSSVSLFTTSRPRMTSTRKLIVLDAEHFSQIPVLRPSVSHICTFWSVTPSASTATFLFQLFMYFVYI